MEAFYWAAITVSQTLGTALGDWMADSAGLGYEGGALVFGAALVVVAAAYYWTELSPVLLFWLPSSSPARSARPSVTCSTSRSPTAASP